jgi:hypothetical protein
LLPLSVCLNVFVTFAQPSSVCALSAVTVVPAFSDVPLSYRSAISDPTYGDEWQHASDIECCWTVVNRASGVSLVRRKYVYRVKQGPNGNVTTFNARLVVMGCMQGPGSAFDPANLSAPVVGLTSLRTVFAVASKFDNTRDDHWDAASAFGYGQVTQPNICPRRRT